MLLALADGRAYESDSLVRVALDNSVGGIIRSIRGHHEVELDIGPLQSQRIGQLLGDLGRLIPGSNDKGKFPHRHGWRVGSALPWRQDEEKSRLPEVAVGRPDHTEPE